MTTIFLKPFFFNRKKSPVNFKKVKKARIIFKKARIIFKKARIILPFLKIILAFSIKK